MWPNIQHTLGKSFFNFSIWLSNNEKSLNITSQDFYCLSLDSQYTVIKSYFESRGLTIGDNLHLHDNKTPIFTRDTGNQFYDELKKMIWSGFEYINKDLVSHKM